jgi:hypothetical protein
MTENIGTFGEYGEPDFAMEEIAEPTEQEIAKAISHPVLTHLNQRLEALLTANEQLLEEKNNAVKLRLEANDYGNRLRTEIERNKYNLKETLAEMISDDEIEFDVATRIAEIFDVQLTKRIEVEYKITATATIEVPLNADEDDVASEVYVDRVDLSSYNSDFDVLETDYEVEDWSVRS